MGAPLAWVWGVRGRALSQPRPLVCSGMRPGPTTHWLWVRGLRAWGPVTNPTARALACCGSGMRVPGGAASCLGVGRPGTGALAPPTSRPFGRAVGAHYPLAVGAGGAGLGTRHQPQSACSCVLWGRHEGARGGRLLPACRASADGRSPTADLSSVRACGRGPLPTGCGCGGCGRGHPSPMPQRALLRAGFARCGGGMRVPGGGASCLGVGRPRTGAPPPPTSRPFGHAAGAHYQLAVGAGHAGVGTRHQRHSARSCALSGRYEGARGGRLLPGCGASGGGRSPTPDLSSVRACRRGPLPTGCGCGGCGRGDPSPTPQRALLRAGFARCGGGMRVPGGGRLLSGCGAPGDGRSPTPHFSSVRACGRGPLPTGCGCGGCGRGDLSPTSQRALVRTVGAV